ncbi:MAG: hypothetical protein HKN37_00180, partial [Rhodothermales bacterium]|nr:hypothetical protein [Rhodothermales bacterium]
MKVITSRSGPRTAYLVLATVLFVGSSHVRAQAWVQKSTADSEWIVFSSGRSGGGDVYAVQAISGEFIHVADSPAPESSVRYDSHRDRIVYTRYDDRRAMLVSEGRDLFEDPNGDVAPVWSPDGWRIAYTAMRRGQEDLYVARRDGSREKRFTNDAETDRYPAWSPDGNHIVFARRDVKGWDLFTLDLRDPSPVPERLTQDSVYVGHPAWSPDGQFIAFDTLVDGQSEIAMLEVESGEITRLTERAGNDLVPSWSLDGRRLAFGARPDSTGNWDIWTVDVETKVIERVTKHADFDGGPVVVPASA